MADEEVREVKTEMVPVEQHALDAHPMDIDEMKKIVKYVDQFKRDILEHGKDYMKIPGTGKPSLLKPGAEKLAYTFGLGFEHKVLEAFEDWDKEWEYERYDKYKKQEVKEAVKGFYSYRVECTVFHKKTGSVWGKAVASCDSSERGRETSPANTVLQMAEKRAFIAAVRYAVNASDLFTQDLEDYRGDQSVQTDARKERPPSEKQMSLIRELTRKKYFGGTPENNEFLHNLQKWMESDPKTMFEAGKAIDKLKELPDKDDEDLPFDKDGNLNE